MDRRRELVRDWKFHCDVLCVPETATAREIKHAYRKLALRCHPDRNGGTPQSNDKFQRISSSYRYLMRNISFRPTPQTSSGTAEPSPSRSVRSPLETALRRIPARFYPAAAAAVVAAAAVFALSLQRYEGKQNSGRNPASIKRDDYGREISSCELMAFKAGNLEGSWKNETTEVDCEIKCSSWFYAHHENDGSCIWKGNEFRQQRGLEADLTNSVTSTDKADMDRESLKNALHQSLNPEEIRIPTFILGDIPDLNAPIPVWIRHVSRSDVLEVEFSFVPKVWISDPSIVRAEMGLSPHQIRIIPKRIGEVTVVITNQHDQADGRFFIQVAK